MSTTRFKVEREILEMGMEKGVCWRGLRFEFAASWSGTCSRIQNIRSPTKMTKHLLTSPQCPNVAIDNKLHRVQRLMVIYSGA